MTAPGVPFDAQAEYPSSQTGSSNQYWSNPSVADGTIGDYPENFTIFWDSNLTSPGSSALAGAQFQVADNIGMTVNARTITSPTIVDDFFQFGDAVIPFGYFGNVADNKIVYWRIRARNGNFQTNPSGFLPRWDENTSVGVYGPWTNPAPLKIGQVPPTPPTTFTVNSFFGGSALAAWSGTEQQQGVPPITGYVIRYSKDDTFVTGVTQVFVNTNNTNRLFTGLDEGDTYYFQIRSINDDGAGDWSPAVEVEIVISPFQPQFRIDSPGTQGPVFFSLAGHLAGFDTQGSYVEGINTDRDYAVRLHSPVATDFSIINNQFYARDVSGDTLYFVRNEESPGFSSTNIIRFKAFLNGENFNLSWVGNPSFPTVYAGKDFSITIDYGNQEVILESEYTKNEVRETETCVTPISSLDLDGEIAVTVQYERLNVTDPITGSETFDYELLVSLNPSDDYSNPIHCRLDYLTDARDAVTQRWSTIGLMRSLLTSNDRTLLSESNVVDWELPVPYTIDPTLPLYGPVPSLNENVWTYIQDAASATYGEVAVVNDIIDGRQVGERILDITNVVGSPTITPTTVFAGRKVAVSYTNAEVRPQGVMYYSLDDDNRILSVGPGETIVNTVESKGSPTYIQQPVPLSVTQFLEYVASGNDFPFSCYGIIDETKLPISPALWSDYFGSVSAEINNEIPGSIDITLVGPNQTIPGTTPPYSLAFGAGVNENPFGAFVLVGSGVVDNVEEIEMFTGAPLDRTPTQLASTINNVFINTKEQAYDRGVWAADVASGPRVTLTGDIPISGLQGFGFTAGSIIKYRDNFYRVTSVSLGNLSASFTAVEHVTVENFDDVWGNLDVVVHDFVWGDNQVQDQKIFPFRDVGYPQI